MKFYYMEHRGSLDDSLKTMRQVSPEHFLEFCLKYDYRFYCYDERINCIRFILDHHEKHFDLPCWLLIEVLK